MVSSLLLSVILALPAGTIEGSIAPPDKARITKPIQVVVFTGDYVNLYLAEVQKRLDNYWEDFRETRIREKETFLLLRERALKGAVDLVLDQMRKDDPRNIARYVQTITSNAFEFRGVPEGECRVVAVVTIGSQEFVWSDSAILKGDQSALVVLKPTTP